MLKMAMKMVLATERVMSVSESLALRRNVLRNEICMGRAMGTTRRTPRMKRSMPLDPNWPLPRPTSLMASRTVTRTPRQIGTSAASKGTTMAITAWMSTMLGSRANALRGRS